MADINTGGPHYKALEYIKEKGGCVPLHELSTLEKKLDFKVRTLTISGLTKIEKEMVYLTEKGYKRLEEN